MRSSHRPPERANQSCTLNAYLAIALVSVLRAQNLANSMGDVWVRAGHWKVCSCRNFCQLLRRSHCAKVTTRMWFTQREDLRCRRDCDLYSLTTRRWKTAQQLEECGDRTSLLESVRVQCPFGAEVRNILLSCVSRVPALQSCCLNPIRTEAPDLSIAHDALHSVREELAHFSWCLC